MREQAALDRHQLTADADLAMGQAVTAAVASLRAELEQAHAAQLSAERELHSRDSARLEARATAELETARARCEREFEAALAEAKAHLECQHASTAERAAAEREHERSEHARRLAALEAMCKERDDEIRNIRQRAREELADATSAAQEHSRSAAQRASAEKASAAHDARAAAKAEGAAQLAAAVSARELAVRAELDEARLQAERTAADAAARADAAERERDSLNERLQKLVVRHDHPTPEDDASAPASHQQGARGDPRNDSSFEREKRFALEECSRLWKTEMLKMAEECRQEKELAVAAARQDEKERASRNLAREEHVKQQPEAAAGSTQRADESAWPHLTGSGIHRQTHASRYAEDAQDAHHSWAHLRFSRDDTVSSMPAAARRGDGLATPPKSAAATGCPDPSMSSRRNWEAECEHLR